MFAYIFLFLVSKGRIFFGVLFLAPLLSQFLNYNKIESILGVPVLVICLFIGFFWGLYATIKGKWFWF
jgi:hypothetical protein